MRPRAGGCPQHKGCSCGCRSTRTTPPGRRCRCRRRSRWRTFALRCASGAGSGGWPASPKATRRRLEPPGSIRQRRPVRHGLLGGRGSLGRAGTPHGAHARPERGHPALPGPMVAADPRGGPAPGPPEPARPRGTGSGAGLRARAWEVHAKGYWNQVRNADGTTYPTEETYFRHVLGLASWRTVYKRLAIGRMLTTFEEPERSLLRSSLARVGLAKATVVAPAIERLEEWRTWLPEALAAHVHGRRHGRDHGSERGWSQRQGCVHAHFAHPLHVLSHSNRRGFGPGGKLPGPLFIYSFLPKLGRRRIVSRMLRLLIGLLLLLGLSDPAGAVEYRLQVANLHRDSFVHYFDGPLGTGSGELAWIGWARSWTLPKSRTAPSSPTGRFATAGRPSPSRSAGSR